jgi:hypothetical protein
MKRITVTIADDGTATVETRGFSGPECETATRDLETALYGRPGQSRRTPEYYHRATVARQAESGQ